jgi:hypothetical protein
MADFTSATTMPASSAPAARARAGSLAWLRQANAWALVSLPLSLLWLEGLGSALGIMAAVVAIRQIKADDHQRGGYWLSVASIAVGLAGLLAVLILGMVAYLGLAISLGHR